MRYKLWRGKASFRERAADRLRAGLHSSYTKRLPMMAGVLLLAGAVFLQIVSVKATPDTTGLVGHWALNETTGITAPDSSGNNNIGTLHNSPTWTTGVSGNALAFNRLDSDYVSMGSIPAVEGINKATISAWIKRDAANSRVLVGKQGNQHDFAIEAWNDGLIYFQLSNGSWAYGSVASNDTNWHHVALVFDGTQTGNGSRLKGYLDGVEQTLAFTGTVPATTSTQAGAFQLGRTVNTYSDGLIDDVQLYSRALSTAEVQDLAVFDTTAPTTPTGLSASAISETEVNLTWTASTDAVGVTGYKVYRDNVQVATTTNNSYSDTGLTANTTYQYKVAAYDADNNVSTQTSTVSATTPADSIWPLEFSSDGRHIETANGDPYLINGDTPWSLFVEPTKEEAEMYLEDRRARGFNTIMVNLIEAYYNGPVNAYNEGPFTTPNDFTTPNEDYFDHVDWVMDVATEKGFTVLMAPAYLGVTSYDGWRNAVEAAGPTVMEAYGEYVGNRYKDYDNIIWVMGGDYGPHTHLDEVQALAAGIKSEDTNADMMTAHNSQYESAVTQYPANEPWLTLNNTYSDCVSTPKHAIADYQRSGPLPFFYIEGRYENETGTQPCVRAEAYWPILLGANGNMFGNSPIWLFNPGWKDALNSQGAQDMERKNELFLSRDWEELVPDINHTVLTAGYGNDDDGTYAAAARTSDGDTIIVFTPQDRDLTIDMSKISSSTSTARAWWFNPTNGATTNLGTYTTSGSQVFNPPAAGQWVLVIDDADLNLSAPGTGFTDTVAPAVSLTAPAASATVGGYSTLSVSTYDNVGIAGVQFKVNGSNVGSEDTTAPYSYDWNTQTVSDGTYTITAVARDAATNTTTSKSVTVTVDNSVPPSGPIVAYGFNNSSAPLTDNSGNGNTASCPSGNCPTYGSTNGYNSTGAYSFAGSNNWLAVPNESQFDFTSNFTVSFWMKTGTFSHTWSSFVMKGDSAWGISRFAQTRNGTFGTYGPTAHEVQGSTILDDNAWHHIAVVYNGASKVMYVDGVVDTSTVYSATLSTNNKEVRLGYNEEFAQADFSGYLDDLRIYNRPLSQTEVGIDMTTAVN